MLLLSVSLLLISMTIVYLCGLQSFDEVVRDPGPKTSYDVSIFASGTWKKVLFAFIMFFSLLHFGESGILMLVTVYLMCR